VDLGLDGKVAIVGGGSDGIGYGIAEVLAREGAKVAIFARREPRLGDAAARLRAETGADVLAVQGDCGMAADITRVVATVVEHFGRIDVLVNNDGGPPIAEIETFDDAAWQKALERHFFYVVRMVREGLPHLKEAGSGSILNVVGRVATEPRAEYGLSVATWAAVIGYSKTLAKEVGKYNITVNSLLSGVIETPRLERSTGGRTMEERVARIPLGRIGTTEEFGSVVALLASARGQYVNGSAIRIDGGLSDLLA
jgi:3-oxoacyl-[acyl-carrier protein] reductase